MQANSFLQRVGDLYVLYKCSRAEYLLGIFRRSLLRDHLVQPSEKFQERAVELCSFGENVGGLHCSFNWLLFIDTLDGSMSTKR